MNDTVTMESANNRVRLILVVCFCGYFCTRLHDRAFAASIAPAVSRQLSALVLSFYRPYLSNTPDNEPPEATNVISAWATPSLKRLIQADDACEIRTQGVCNLDFDIIIDAQDWELKRLPTTSVELARDGAITVRCRFINDGEAMEVDYVFNQVSGRWLIDDVDGVTAGESWHLKKMLSGDGP